MPTPAEFPQNALTKIIEEAALRNVGGKAHAVSAGSMPTVRSAALGQPVPDAPSSLSLDERQELDERARSLGILPPLEGEQGAYGTLEEAMNAGQPVNQRVVAERMVPTPPARLPDLRNIQGIDLQLNVAYVDNLDFPIPPEDAERLRRYVIELVRNQVTEAFNQAIAEMDNPATLVAEGKDGQTSVQDVQVRKSTKRVPTLRTKKQKTKATLSRMHEDEKESGDDNLSSKGTKE